MSFNESAPTPGFKKETLEHVSGNTATFSAERGGLITSLKLQGKEVLYLDEETFNNKESNVKGGIPVLFPNAGPVPDDLKTEELKNLKQHGFAREVPWNSVVHANGFTQVLESSTKTKESYPYDFKLSLEGTFEDNNSFTVNQIIENKEAEKELPVSSGLHPYFAVPLEEKKNIEFDFEGGDVVKEKFEIWANGKAVSIPNPGTQMKITIPTIGTLVLEASKEYERIWVWSMPEKDFICVEPVMRDKGGIVTNPTNIKPGESVTARFNINLLTE